MKNNYYLKKRSIYLVFALFLLSVNIFPLDLRFERVGIIDGLAGNSVSGIIQDKRGFIWFSTQDGLNRYDGREFLLFEHEPFNPQSLNHNLIQTIFYDSDKDLIWLGTYRGVCVLDPRTEKIIHSLPAENPEAKKILEHGVITAIEKDRDGNYWIGTLDGLVKIDPETGLSNVYNYDPDNEFSLPDKTVRDILCDSQGRIWISTYNGLSLYSDGRFTTYFRENEPDKNKQNICITMSIEEYSPGVFIIGSWGGGITVFDADSGTYFNRKLDDNRIYALKRDSHGHIWAGTWGGGLYYYESIDSVKINNYIKTVFNHDNKYSLSNDIVYSLFEDQSGLLWIGTNGGGVNKLNQLHRDYRFLYFNGRADSIGNDRFKSLLEDDDKRLWIGSYNTGLSIFDPENKKIRKFINNPYDFFSLSDNTVNSIFSDSRKEIWILTNSGLNRFRKKDEKFERYYISEIAGEGIIKAENPDLSDSPGGNFYAAAEDEDGRLWLGTYTDGVYVWHPESGMKDHFSIQSPEGKKLSDNMIYSIVRDKSGIMWIATNNGLNSYDPETEIMKNYFHNPEDPYSLCHNNVRILYCDTSGNLWIGTIGGGLSRFDSETDLFYNFSKKDGLDHNTVIGLSEDNTGNIIAVTLKGISLIETAPDNKTAVITSLTYQFGLNGIDLKDGVARDDDGSIYVTATGEIYKLDTSFYYLNRFNPEIIITDLKIFDKSYIDIFGKNIFAEEEEIKLGWDENYISFDFTSIDYSFPSGRKYKYMLEGFDRGWIYSGERNFTSYISIPPGRYTFRVTGTNSSGYWSTNEASIKIRIIPPVYKTPAAYFIYLILAVSLFYGIMMIIRGREAQKRLEEVSRLRDELLHVNQKLDMQTRMDILTGVHNRKHFNEVFENFWDLYSRTGINFTVLMLDIDYFKKYNDTYGHVQGDICLKAVADLLLEAVSRKTDSVFRYGGEEFVILLVDTDTTGARIVAERICAKIRDKKIPNQGIKNGKGILTVSIGISGTKDFKPETSRQLLIEADRNLYRAKDTGRDRVV